MEWEAMTVFCVKYPAEHALKLKGVQGAQPPEW